MKKLVSLCLVITAVFVLRVQAQISIAREDFPGIGMRVITATDNTTAIDPGQPGLNQTWNFSNMVVAGHDSTYYITPSEAPGYQNYPSANIATKHNPLSYPNGYNVNFWDYSTVNIKGIADESLINIFGDFYMAFHIRYSPPSANLDFSIDYGDSKAQNFTIDWITASRSQGVTVDSTRSISHVALNCIADAAGTMVLPSGSFPVLRVKEVFNTVDSAFTWNGAAWVFNTVTTDAWTQYRWYAKNYGEVGFYRPDAKDAGGFTFFESQTLVGMDNLQDVREITLFPNPAKDVLNVHSTDPISQIDLFDPAGRLLKKQGRGTTVDISTLASGQYFVRIHRGSSVVIKSFCKE